MFDRAVPLNGLTLDPLLIRNVYDSFSGLVQLKIKWQDNEIKLKI